MILLKVAIFTEPSDCLRKSMIILPPSRSKHFRFWQVILSFTFGKMTVPPLHTALPPPTKIKYSLPPNKKWHRLASSEQYPKPLCYLLLRSIKSLYFPPASSTIHCFYWGLRFLRPSPSLVLWKTCGKHGEKWGFPHFFPTKKFPGLRTS